MPAAAAEVSLFNDSGWTIVFLRAVTPGLAGNLLNVSFVEDAASPGDVTVEVTDEVNIIVHWNTSLAVGDLDNAIDGTPSVAALIYLDFDYFNATCGA